MVTIKYCFVHQIGEQTSNNELFLRNKVYLHLLLLFSLRNSIKHVLSQFKQLKIKHVKYLTQILQTAKTHKKILKRLKTKTK
jgi:hypothetical protein